MSHGHPGRAFERITDALQALELRGQYQDNKAHVQCPAHEDRNPSLSVTRTDNKTLLHCFSGCQVPDIMAALGLPMSDLFDFDRMEWRYLDPDTGEVFRTVSRNGNKQYRQSVNDPQPRLLNLDKLRKAKEQDEPVYLVEGEKDTDTLSWLGHFATTAPMGAGNFDKVDVTPLTGLGVIAVVDRDEAGTAWAQQVQQSVASVAQGLTFKAAKTGKDISDHVAAGYSVEDLEDYELKSEQPTNGHRQIVLTKASAIRPTRVRWLWQDRLALGTIGLLAGREGVGKTTAAYWLAAVVTKGALPGENHEHPKGVLIAASEDSWSHTIVPRLIAAGADLDRVYRIEVITDGIHTEISLPRDLHALEEIAGEVDAALLLLDPLMSRLSDTLDTHRDAEVRRALEPLAALADRAGLAVLGLIHHNKSGSSDPLQLVMGSKAFTAVARSVHTVVADPEDETETRRLFGTPKNNLGRSDLPTLAFTIASHAIETQDGIAWTGRLVWGENSTTSISEAMRQHATRAEDNSSISEAAEWLKVYLTAEGGGKESAKVKSAGQSAGHNETALKRAKLRLAVTHKNKGYPAKTWWFLPGFEDVPPVGSQLGHFSRGDDLTELTELTTGEGVQSAQVAQSDRSPARVTQPAEPKPGDTPCESCGQPLGWAMVRRRQTVHQPTCPEEGAPDLLGLSTVKLHD